MIVLSRLLARRLAQRQGLTRELSEDVDRRTAEPPTNAPRSRDFERLLFEEKLESICAL